MNRTYLVTWTIDIDIDDEHYTDPDKDAAYWAAWKAHEIQRDPMSVANVFEVVEEDGRGNLIGPCYQVNLDGDGEQVTVLDDNDPCLCGDGTTRECRERCNLS